MGTSSIFTYLFFHSFIQQTLKKCLSARLVLCGSPSCHHLSPGLLQNPPELPASALICLQPVVQVVKKGRFLGSRFDGVA